MIISNFKMFKSLFCNLLFCLILLGFPMQMLSASAPRETTSLQTGESIDEKQPAETKVIAAAHESNAIKTPSMITQAGALAFLSVFPFIIMILTSFLKIVVVLSLLRSALGVQSAPPNQILNGVAFMLSLFIMYPTGIKMYEAAEKTMAANKAPDSLTSPESSAYILAVAKDAIVPMREFLKRNSNKTHQALFYRMAYRVLPVEYRGDLKIDDVIIIVPAFITSQLKDAFEIGVLIYIPFFVIDLVTSNVLLAMGMMMLSPVTISMPLKLFLLVMLDGWTLLIQGLVSTFR